MLIGRLKLSGCCFGQGWPARMLSVLLLRIEENLLKIG